MIIILFFNYKIIKLILQSKDSHRYTYTVKPLYKKPLYKKNLFIRKFVTHLVGIKPFPL